MPQGEKICEAKLCPLAAAKQRDYRLDSLFVFCFVRRLGLEPHRHLFRLPR